MQIIPRHIFTDQSQRKCCDIRWILLPDVVQLSPNESGNNAVVCRIDLCNLDCSVASLFPLLLICGIFVQNQLDQNLTFSDNLGRVCRMCFFHHLRQIRTLQRSFLLHALMRSMVDYSNVVYEGLTFPSLSNCGLIGGIIILLFGQTSSSISSFIFEDFHCLPMQKHTDNRIVMLMRNYFGIYVVLNLILGVVCRSHP